MHMLKKSICFIIASYIKTVYSPSIADFGDIVTNMRKLMFMVLIKLTYILMYQEHANAYTIIIQMWTVYIRIT